MTVVCPDCGMSTWEDGVGCLMPGCDNFRVLADDFEGHAPRRCGEHRTVGSHRAWCYDCSEWCYPNPELACAGCGPSREELEALVDRYRCAWLSARRRAVAVRARTADEIAEAIKQDPGPDFSPYSPHWNAGYAEAQKDMADVARGIAIREVS